MRLGLSTYALSWNFGIPGHPPEKRISLDEFLELAKECGYGGVQIADNSGIAELSRNDRERILRRARDLDLFVEIGARGMTPENLDHHINLTCDAGSSFLRFVLDGPGFCPDEQDIPGILEEAANRCAEAGLILAIENYERFSVRTFAQWMRKLNHPNLAICLDIVNALGHGDGVRETLDALLPFTVNVHLKDFIIRRQPHMLGFVVEGTPAGEGSFPLAEILSRVAATGLCQSLTVEHWPAPGDSMEETCQREQDWCFLSLANLRDIGVGPN